MFFKKLYVRIWLAVVLAVAVLTLLVGYAWRLTAEPPLREVVIRNEAGQVIGTGQTQRGRSAEDGADERADASPPEPGEAARLPPRRGPEFMVRMQDGQVLHMHLPRINVSTWSRAPFGFFLDAGLGGRCRCSGHLPHHSQTHPALGVAANRGGEMG